MSAPVKIIGAGLAGCEAAWQAAKMGVSVELYEMKPQKYTPAHKNPMFCELVCSNSLRSNDVTNAVGLLKAELSRLDSLILEAAYAAEVPAGSALAVDRDMFSSYVTGKLEREPNIRIISGEAESFSPDEITVVASGPLTSETLSRFIAGFTGEGGLHFFDAAAPIVDASTIDMERAFFASRYGRGDACDYLNCPLTEDEYNAFYDALVTAQEAELHDFDKNEQLTVFEGCMPVEVMAKRGRDTLRFGPMKPVGLPDPATGREHYAVVQLRRENISASMYNLVGFQTHLTFGEQRRVFGLIPALKNASFLRYGVMHRNTFLNSPELLCADYSVRRAPNIFFAGQMTGVEGYVESASSGYVAGVNAARRALGLTPFIFPAQTEIGALAHYVSSENADFQPMNANFGIIEPLSHKVKGGKAARNSEYAARSLALCDEIRRMQKTL
ncbi:MAG: methylenetetrahydrofolate--tRNA-(uracil(54)-C(5))-methyltransferase (FADH(2)-oxidizing) TrmFO [Eubacteriales bacterium]